MTIMKKTFVIKRAAVAVFHIPEYQYGETSPRCLTKIMMFKT